MTRITNDLLKNPSIMLWGALGIHVCAWRPRVRSSLAYRGVKARRDNFILFALLELRSKADNFLFASLTLERTNFLVHLLHINYAQLTSFFSVLLS